MAKRNKKLKNVQISNEELVPTTIGYLETRQKGPFLLIFIFAVLFATLYFMPQITNYMNMFFNPELYEEMKNQKKFADDSTGIVEALTPDLVLYIYGTKFSNFAIKNNQLTYSVDNSSSKTDFSNYYLETYDKDKKLMERVLIPSTSVTALDINYTNIKFISISHYKEGVYPSIVLDDSTLTCTKTNEELVYTETYKYTYQKVVLATLDYNYKMTKKDNNTEEYNNMLNKFTADAETSTDGVTSSLARLENGFEFKKEENLLVLTQSSLENGYNYQIKADQIAFEMSTKGYICN